MRNYFEVDWQEDGTAKIRARITADDGSGAATGVAGEGNWLKEADIATNGITWKAFTLVDGEPSEKASGTFVTADVIHDTPVTSTVNWRKDRIGYNFEAMLADTTFGSGDVTEYVEIRVELAGGTVFWGVFHGPVNPLFYS